MRRFFFFVVVASSFFVGCGGDSCEAKSTCSSDPAPTVEQIASCKSSNRQADGGVAKCAAESRAYADCAASNRVCGTDNKTDVAATAAKCTSQQSALTTCNAT